MPTPSALSRIGMGLLRTKISVRSRAAPAFSLVCSHALLAVPVRPLLLVWNAPTCADEIYAGHVAEHMDDVKASFARWFEVLKPGGRITITVPDCRGANRMWLERKRFPALELGPDEGIIAITTE